MPYEPPKDGPWDPKDPTPASDEDVDLITGWIWQYLFDDGEFASLIEMAVETYKQRASVSIDITPQLIYRVEQMFKDRVADDTNTFRLSLPRLLNLLKDN